MRQAAINKEINIKTIKTMLPNKMSRKIGGNDTLYYVINGAILFLLAAIVIYPLYFIIIASISSPDAIFSGEVYLWPKDITFSGYRRLLGEKLIWSGYLNTLIYTFGGTLLSIAITIPAGWALSRKELPARKLITTLFIITMFFGGGLIPFYQIVSALGLVGSPLAVILPGALSVWNLFMTKAFFENSIPKGMIEACQVDGAGHFRIFFTMVIPLSKAIIAVMSLYYAVGNWNSYFNALIFLSDEKYFPLQLVLREILIMSEASSASASAETILEQAKLANQIKYGSIIISSLPIILVYPFVQKFFNQGIMVGSIKS